MTLKAVDNKLCHRYSTDAFYMKIVLLGDIFPHIIAKTFIQSFDLLPKLTQHLEMTMNNFLNSAIVCVKEELKQKKQNKKQEKQQKQKEMFLQTKPEGNHLDNQQLIGGKVNKMGSKKACLQYTKMIVAVTKVRRDSKVWEIVIITTH